MRDTLGFPTVPLSADQKAMLQLLLERGQSYDDLASILGVGPDEVRSRARTALKELAGEDPDRNVALTDYLLGQADPIDRADAVRHLKDDPEDLALVTELAQKLRLVAPEAELPRLPGEERQPRARGARRERMPKPLRRLVPAGRSTDEKGERPPRTTLSRRQTQGIVLAGCGAVLIAVVVLAIAGVFSSGSADSATTGSTTTSTPATAGKVQGYPLVPIAASNSQGQGQIKLAADGSFEDSIPIPTAVQSILPNVQAVAITLAKDKTVAQSIQDAVKNQQAILTVEGKTDFVGVVGSQKGNVFPIPLKAAKGVKGSGQAALGVANKQPFFQIKMTGLDQPPKGSSYIIWLVVGTSQKQ
jgi:anti-sigma factor RsiW